jgi:hypothetical protein
VDVVVHLRRGRDGRRIVSEIGLLQRVDDALRVEPAWTPGCPHGPAAAQLRTLLDRAERSE